MSDSDEERKRLEEVMVERRRAASRRQAASTTGPPVTDEQGLANIIKMARLYRQDPGGTDEKEGTT